MSFLDNLKDRFRGSNDDYYDDYEDDYYDEPQQARHESETTGLLGNTRRPEAESVSVYTRSGKPLTPGAQANQAGGYAPQGYQRDQVSTGVRPEYAPRTDYASRTDYSAQSEYATRTDYVTRQDVSDRHYSDFVDETTQMPSTTTARSTASTSVLGNTTSGHTPADIGLKAVPRGNSSGQLPPYVLKPVSYDDVQMVVRRVRTNQPVVLAFRNTNIETAKRILDFCFGLACGIGGRVDELGDRVFVVMPAGLQLTQADIDKLASDGTLQR